MNKTAFIATILLMVLLGCLGTTSVPDLQDQTPAPEQLSTPDEEELFLAYLNLEEMPDTISHFRGEGADVFPVFLSSGYFSYQADAGYFDMLQEHDRFIEQSGFNEQIHQVECTGHDIPDDFSWWTEDSISITGKTCYQGIIFPYVHYILYDSQTGQVTHFVTGMRD